MAERTPREPRTGAASERRTFLWNALTSYGQTGLAALTALLLTPYLFRTLGVAGFGTWSVMFTLMMVFNMLEIGFSAGTTKFIAELRARDRREEMDATLGASVVLMTALGLLAMAVTVLIGLLLPGLASDDERGAFQAGMVILGLALVARLPLTAYGAALAGYQRYDLFNVGRSVTIAGLAIGSVIAVEAGGGVLGVAVAYAVALIGGGLCHLALLRRLDPDLRLRPRESDRAAHRRVLRFNTFTLLAESMNLIAVRFDTVVIAALRSATAAAPFAAASKLYSGLQALTIPVISLMLPMVSDLEARGLRDAVIRRFLTATRVTLQVTIPVALAMAFFSRDIVDLWLGADAPAVTSDIITVLALHAVTLCAVPAQQVLVGVGRARATGILNTIWGLSNLAISIVLVSAYGAIGAALGTLISSFLVGPINFPLACRAIGCSLRRLLEAGLWRAVSSSLPSVAAMAAIWLLMSPGAGRLLLGVAVGVGLAVLIGLLQLGPRQALAEIRAALGRTGPQPETATSRLAEQDAS